MLKKKNSLADRLSRRLPNSKWPNELTKDIKEFIDCELSALKYIASPFKMEAGLLLEDLYLKESQKIIKWLVTLQRLEEINIKEFRKFKQYMLKFLVRNWQLFYWQSKNILMWRVVDNEITRQEIIKNFYNWSGYYRQEGMY